MSVEIVTTVRRVRSNSPHQYGVLVGLLVGIGLLGMIMATTQLTSSDLRLPLSAILVIAIAPFIGGAQAGSYSDGFLGDRMLGGCYCGMFLAAVPLGIGAIWMGLFGLSPLGMGPTVDTWASILIVTGFFGVIFVPVYGLIGGIGAVFGAMLSTSNT